ncbi:MAG TPA: hypothetical protein VGF52_02215 [Tepidisphaeraceae bacterium]|jgi:hypothetical protein
MIETLHEMLNREPFAAFRIVLTSGKEHEISDPYLVAVGQTQITVYAPKSDRFSILRLNQIASIESAQAA